MKIILRILDDQAQRAANTEFMLKKALKAYEIPAEVFVVRESLEFIRLGLSTLPALELNNMIINQGATLTREHVDDLCGRLRRGRITTETHR